MVSFQTSLLLTGKINQYDMSAAQIITGFALLPSLQSWLSMCGYRTKDRSLSNRRDSQISIPYDPVLQNLFLLNLIYLAML